MNLRAIFSTKLGAFCAPKVKKVAVESFRCRLYAEQWNRLRPKLSRHSWRQSARGSAASLTMLLATAMRTHVSQKYHSKTSCRYFGMCRGSGESAFDGLGRLA